MVLKKDRTYRLCAVFTALNKIPKIQKHALRNLNAFSSSGCCCFCASTSRTVIVDVVIWKGIRSRSDTNRTGPQGLSFYYRKLLYCPDQMLAAMLLSQNRVSLFKTPRLRAPFGARCMGHAIKMWSAFCSEAMHF